MSKTLKQDRKWLNRISFTALALFLFLITMKAALAQSLYYNSMENNSLANFASTGGCLNVTTPLNLNGTYSLRVGNVGGDLPCYTKNVTIANLHNVTYEFKFMLNATNGGWQGFGPSSTNATSGSSSAATFLSQWTAPDCLGAAGLCIDGKNGKINTTLNLTQGRIYYFRIKLEPLSATETNMYVYLNSTYYANGSVARGIQSFNFLGGHTSSVTEDFVMDDLQIYNDSIETPANFSITATDYSDAANLNNITAQIEGVGNFTTEAGLITTNLVSNITKLYNVTLYSNQSGGYFPRVYLNTNATTLAGQLWQAELLLFPRTIITNVSISGGNFSAGSQLVPNGDTLKLRAGTTNITFNHSVYGVSTQPFTLTAQTNTSQNMYVGNTRLNVTARNALNLSFIDNFNVTATYGTFSTTVTSSAGFAYLDLLQNLSFNVSIDAPGYALTSSLVTPNGTSPTMRFDLYPTNSIYINIFDEATGLRIMQNVTVTFSSNSTEFHNVTNTSTLFTSGLEPTTYQVQFNSSGYSVRAYTLTVGDRSTQTLNAYLATGTSSTIFSVKDFDTSVALENALATMQRNINGSWQNVESRFTDVTGNVQFSYIPFANYRFIFTKDGYDNKVFNLNPILSNSYTINMQKSTLIDFSQDFDKIGIIYSPQSFDNGTNTTFNFIFSSPAGSLISYGINLTYPGGSTLLTGSNAIGSQLSASINLSGAGTLDTVTLHYFYETTVAGHRNYTVNLPIIFSEVNVSTFLTNRNEHYGMTTAERIIIMTIIVLCVVGLASFFGQPVGGLALGIFLFGYYVYTGFLPIWSVIPTIFIGVMFLIWKGDGQ